MRKLCFFVSGIAVLLSPCAVASADPDDSTTSIIRQQDQLGETPGQIANQLHQGDPRISWGQAANDVWDALQ